MTAQVETGHLCPVTMTRAAIAALAPAPELACKIVPKVLTRTYDANFQPWWEKAGLTLGMGMTERQGGTDVRANTTKATPTNDGYSIDGEKWFFSAPMSDAFLVLAQAQGGLTCFLMPRFRSDGSVNGLRFQRLKDKLGNRSNASSEVEFADAFAWRVGDEGAGVRTILQMVQLTRIDCAIASAGIMRMAFAQAIHHCRYRKVFQKDLLEQPMMRAVLADMALDLEGAVALVMRVCRALDRASADPREAAYARLLTPVAKYWICKIAPAFVFEAMECLGGNGYVEESLLPRLYREAPVNAIWEGSGNVMCLDVLRALRREEEGRFYESLSRSIAVPAPDGAPLTIDSVNEASAPALVGRLALMATVAELKTSAPQAVVEAFARTRLVQRHGPLYGAHDIDASTVELLLQRALPER
jgi:putative acyl-CoA dehydrogenase